MRLSFADHHIWMIVWFTWTCPIVLDESVRDAHVLGLMGSHVAYMVSSMTTGAPGVAPLVVVLIRAVVAAGHGGGRVCNWPSDGSAACDSSASGTSIRRDMVELLLLLAGCRRVFSDASTAAHARSGTALAAHTAVVIQKLRDWSIELQSGGIFRGGRLYYYLK